MVTLFCMCRYRSLIKETKMMLKNETVALEITIRPSCHGTRNWTKPLFDLRFVLVPRDSRVLLLVCLCYCNVYYIVSNYQYLDCNALGYVMHDL